jgi:small GTP-binding protein
MTSPRPTGATNLRSVTKTPPPSLPVAVNGGSYDFAYKVVLLGNSGVGKTSFCHSLDGRPGESTVATLGVEFMSKVYRIDSRTVVMQLWDTAGMETFAPVVRSYFQGARAIILVYSVDNRASFDAVSDRWRRDIDQMIPRSSNTRVFVVANKTDVPKDKWQITKEDGLNSCAPWGWYFFEACAVDGKRTEQLFTEIVNALINDDNALRVSTGRVSENSKAIPGAIGGSPRPNTTPDVIKLDGARNVSEDAIAGTSNVHAGTRVRPMPRNPSDDNSNVCGC